MSGFMNRRQVLKQALFSAALGTAVSTPSHAVSGKLSATDPIAAKLGYVEKTAQVDVQHFPTFKQGQSCANCILVQLHYGFWRPCKLFPGKLVSAGGWCAGWAPTTQS